MAPFSYAAADITVPLTGAAEAAETPASMAAAIAIKLMRNMG